MNEIERLSGRFQQHAIIANERNHLVVVVQAILAKHQFDPHRLRLENPDHQFGKFPFSGHDRAPFAKVGDMAGVMHPNQIETSPNLVRGLLQQQVPELADLQIAAQPLSGTDNAVYRVGERFSVRLPIIDWSVGNEERIRPWLPWLRDRLDVEVPVPIHYGEPACGYPHNWTVYPWFQGETLAMGCGDVQVASDIALFLSQLRSLPTDGVPAAGRSPHALDSDVRAALHQLQPEDQPEKLLSIWERFMQMPVWDGLGAVWLHGDVAPGNLIFRENRLVAAIDWAGLGVGDPASDLQVAWNLLNPTARRILKNQMDIDDATWARARARAFAQAAFQLPYYRETNIPLATQAKHVFGEIAAEMEQI